MKYNVDTVRESGWYNKKEWLAVRDYVRQRDKMTCVRCGAFGAKKIRSRPYYRANLGKY